MDIKRFREIRNITQQELAEKCGVSLRTVQNWEAGKSIPASTLLLLESMSNNESISYKPTEDLHYTYLIPQSAMGGSLVGFGVEGVVPENCEKVVSPISDVDFAITIYGDSMSPEYPPGCRALIKRIDPDAFIAWGNVYVLDTVNGVIIKELQPSDEEGKIVCHSQNPNGRFKDFVVSMDDVRGIYRVLACITAK
jgi:phage repressor protein C with HTH and peptisase S24 domain